LSEFTDRQTSDQDEGTYSNGRSYLGTRKYGVLLERSSYSPETPPVTIGFLERYAEGCEVEDGRKGGRHYVSIANGYASTMYDMLWKDDYSLAGREGASCQVSAKVVKGRKRETHSDHDADSVPRL
jgi:hypothetical protein